MIKALGRRILVEEPPRKDISEGGIILPQGEIDVLDVSNWGCIVLSIGDKVDFGPDSKLKVGDMAYLDPSIEYVMFKNVETGKQNMFITQDQLLGYNSID